MDGSVRLDNYGLHRSALLGDDGGVRHALQSGADVNALDDAGWTVIMCVVAGQNWRDVDANDAGFMTESRLNALKILLAQPHLSLLTLNAPHANMNGVIPLSMAAWLNLPLVVHSLLDDSSQSVAVDGMDSHGATALMYAARDGNLDVAKLLLSRGARPDFRDYNHRTSIQFALPHNQVLWLCENVLRRHRWRESNTPDRTRLSPDSEELVRLAQASLVGVDLNPPPLSVFTKESTSRMIDMLISSICSGDLLGLYSLLFSSLSPSPSPVAGPILVNIPDNKGWSPIHYCVAAFNPSCHILDALYCAGADISLFTTYEQQTPLHILVRSFQLVNLSSSLITFIFHLVKDLRAPLSARDKDDETCIHIAAEHGKSLDLLMLLLECDVNRTVRKMKNSRGLTPEDVCRREFISAFHPCPIPSSPILSVQSTDSLISPSEYTHLEPPIHDDASSIHTTQFDFDATMEALLSSLSTTSPSIIDHSHSFVHHHPHTLEVCLDNAGEQYNAIVSHFRARVDEANRVLQDLENKVERINSLRNIVCLASRGKILVREVTPLRPKGYQRDSSDSQLTLLFERDGSIRAPVRPSNSCLSRSVCVGTQTGLLDILANDPMTKINDGWIESFCGSSDSLTCKNSLRDLWNVERELLELRKRFSSSADLHFSSKLAAKMQSSLKKKAKLEAKIVEFAAVGRGGGGGKLASTSGPSRVKAWLKRIVSHEDHHQLPRRKMEIVLDLRNEDGCCVGREVKTSMTKIYADPLDATIDATLRAAPVVLDSARRDLESIHTHLTAARQFIDLANHSITRTQRVFKRAVKKRESYIAELRSTNIDDRLVPPIDAAISVRASISSISSTRSAASSVTATFSRHADEDIRHIRRLLLRKIEAQISGAWDEVDKVTVWLHIIKEVVRGVKRRAYL